MGVAPSGRATANLNLHGSASRLWSASAGPQDATRPVLHPLGTDTPLPLNLAQTGS